MTRKQIDASRELRLWIALGVGVLAAFPEVREKAAEKFVNAKEKLSSKFKK